MIEITWMDVWVYGGCLVFFGWLLGMATYNWLRQRQDRQVDRWESLVRDWEMDTHDHGSAVDGQFSRMRWLPRDVQEDE